MEHDPVCEYDDSDDDNNNVDIFSSPSSNSVHNSHSHPPPSSCSDEITLFLHQMLSRSSSTIAGAAATTSSSSMAYVVPQTQDINAPHLSKSSGISPVDFVNTSKGGGGGSLSGNVMVSGANDNTDDEQDCQSEEGIQASVDVDTSKPAPPQSSSKRSRAAEVHNLSEKRRRSRINEKMKALQNLIPNSNKTDKASMLDEAIEYLKHLQLQVQVLTMRSGLSLHPMFMPGIPPPVQLPQMRMGLGAGNEALHMNSTGTLVSQETLMHNLFSLPNQQAYPNQQPLPNMSNTVNSVTSFGLDASMQANFGPFQHCPASVETSREDLLPHQPLNVSHYETNPSAVLTFKTQESDLRRDRVKGVPQKAIDHKLIPSLHLTGKLTSRCIPGDGMKQERKAF